MEIKTKYNIGQKVWTHDYKRAETIECNHCGRSKLGEPQRYAKEIEISLIQIEIDEKEIRIDYHTIDFDCFPEEDLFPSEATLLLQG